MTESSVNSNSSEKYIRVNVTRNSKGYSYEKTASVRWASTGEEDDLIAFQELDELLSEGDAIARDNIRECERLDATD